MVEVFEGVEDDADAGIAAGGDGDLGGAPVGEVELAGGDAAEGDTAAPQLAGQVEAGSVAAGELLLLPGGWDAGVDDRAHGVDDPLGGQVVAGCDDGAAGGDLLALQDFVALLAQLEARRGMDGVVDALVQRVPATEPAAVGGIRDGVDLEARDVTLPDTLAGEDRPLVGQLRLQLGVLGGEELVAQRLRVPDVHHGPQELLLVAQLARYLGFRVVLFQQVADAEVYVLLSVHTGDVITATGREYCLTTTWVFNYNFLFFFNLNDNIDNINNIKRRNTRRSPHRMLRCEKLSKVVYVVVKKRKKTKKLS